MGSESGARVGQWWETEGDCVEIMGSESGARVS